MSKIYEYDIDDKTIIDNIYKEGHFFNFLEISLRENDIYVFKCGQSSVICRVKNQEFKKIKENRVLKNIKGENKEQQIYFDYLSDDDIDCIIATGPAGSGKGFCAMAYAYEAVKEGKFQKLIITRVPVTPSKKFENGFIKGTLEEKMTPWLQVFYSTIDKIKLLTGNRASIQIENFSLEYIKGITWDNSIIIVDEAEDLTKQELKSILTRVGKNSKIIVLGDIEQTTEKNCKLTLSDACKCFDSEKLTIEEQKMIATIHLEKSLRSEFCSLILKIL
jgi:predicted ribonuclease YlaK